MWGSGSHQKLFQSFQRLGISKGKQGTLSAVDRLTREFDREIVEWKEEMEERFKKNEDVEDLEVHVVESANECPNEHILDHNYAMQHSEQDEQPFSPPMDLSPELFIDSSADADTRTQFTEPSRSNEDENLKWIDTVLESISIADSPKPSDGGETIAAIEHPGYCLVWDNVQLLSTARHQTTERKNKMHLWALCFAAKNRINFRHLPDQRNGPVPEMLINNYLPDTDDFLNMKTRMEVIVMRILKEHLTAFNITPVIQHIPHQYSDESSLKSRIVNLGVIEENPASTQGVIGILDILHQYVPEIDKDNKYHVMPVHGDGLSIERMRDAKSARSGSESAAARFEGIEPVPQEFHKRAILMQVQVWLEKLFGDKPVPAYELNEHTVSTLHSLMRRTEQKERDTKLLIEDLRQKADEYNTEGHRLGNVLSAINLTPSALSQSGVASLRTLANLALILNTKNASESSYILALSHLEDEMRKVEELQNAELRTLNRLVEKTKSAVIKRSTLKNALDDLEGRLQDDDPDLKKQIKETQYIRKKAQEYRTQVHNAQASLDKVGVDPSVYHSALVSRAQELQHLKDEIAPMKEKLESYHGLPPDAIQSHMKLDELREKLAQLEAELTRKIDVMHV